MVLLRLICLSLFLSLASASHAHRRYTYKWWDVVVASEWTAFERSQLKLVQKVKGLIDIVRDASKYSLRECGRQLAGRRWNCSATPNPHTGHSGERAPYFGHFLDFGTREAGYVHALLSAGLLYRMLQNSNRFAIPKDWHDFHSIVLPSQHNDGLIDLFLDNRGRRSVSNSRRNDAERPDMYTCSMETYTECNRLAKHFTDLSDKNRPNDNKRTRLALVNRHNNEVGRLAVRKKGQRKKCACIGPSASCSLKRCYKTLQFSSVAKFLRNQYLNSVEVEMARDDITGNKKLVKTSKNGRRAGNGNRLRIASSSRSEPAPMSIVHIRSSPNFCKPNKRFDLPGTSGRLCNTTAPRSGGCQRLCCGRGHEPVTVERDCNCRYHHCCRLHCETCFETVNHCL